jgi:hypothetical protein
MDGIESDPWCITGGKNFSVYIKDKPDALKN